MTCPITTCPNPVAGPLRVCREHYRLIPRPQAEALNFYAKKNKRGPAHQAAFARAVESVMKVLEVRNPKRESEPMRPVSTPYRDD